MHSQIDEPENGVPHKGSVRAAQPLLAMLPLLGLRVLILLCIIAIAVLASFSWMAGAQGWVGDWYVIAPLSALLLFVLLALRFRKAHPRTRALLQGWLLALLFYGVARAARLHMPSDYQLVAMQQAGLCLLFLALAGGLRRLTQTQLRLSTQGVSAALLASGLLAIPWVLVGALGSALDTLLAGLGGLLFGGAVAYVCCGFLLPGLWTPSQGSFRDILHGGLASAVVIVIMASQFGGNGFPLLLEFQLPLMGFLLAAVARSNWRDHQADASNVVAVALLMGLATAVALGFTDPTAVARILQVGSGSRIWLLGPPIVAGVTALILAPTTALAERLGLSGKHRGVGIAVAVSGWGLAAITYFAFGHVGSYGNRTIVVLKAQVDLTSLEVRGQDSARQESVYGELVRVAESGQAALRQKLTDAHLRYTPFYIVNAIEVESADLPVRWWLSSQPEVDHLVTSSIGRPLPAGREEEWWEPGRTEGPAGEVQWGTRMIGADQVWTELGLHGEGIVIGDIDSGADWKHPQLAASYRGSSGTGATTHDYNWLDAAEGNLTPVDLDGHGTATLSVMVGRDLGVAPDARWIACRVSDLESYTTSRLGSDLSCLQFMLAPFPMGGDPFRDAVPSLSADVVNLSWACPECSADTLQPAMQALRAAGILIVVSAGNEGPACSSLSGTPANLPEVLTIGAVAEDGRVAAFSSVGPTQLHGIPVTKPDVVAPGTPILLAVPGDSYARAEGTSFAAPFVTGSVALLWSAEPTLLGDVASTEDLLRETARPPSAVSMAPLSETPEEEPQLCLAAWRDGAIPNGVFGYGIVDVYRAILTARSQAKP